MCLLRLGNHLLTAGRFVMLDDTIKFTLEELNLLERRLCGVGEGLEFLLGDIGVFSQSKEVEVSVGLGLFSCHIEHSFETSNVHSTCCFGLLANFRSLLGLAGEGSFLTIEPFEVLDRGFTFFAINFDFDVGILTINEGSLYAFIVVAFFFFGFVVTGFV